MPLKIGQALRKGILATFALFVGGYGITVLKDGGDSLIGLGCLVIAACVLVAREALKVLDK
jgi:hypothetical protein